MKTAGFCRIAFPLLVSALCAVPAVAAECSAASGQARVPLLELYTSEGCSSCPPADRWLSGLKTSDLVPARVVPLALHVDYWDYIGWKDRFAQPGFADRQRSQATMARSTFVYTPQVMLNGRDFRGWGNPRRFAETIRAINAAEAGADIRLALHSSTNALEVSADTRTPDSADARLYIAVYENNLATKVGAGENSGATLHHDYVVRAWLGPYPVAESVSRSIPMKPQWKRSDLGVAAFVQDRRSGDVLQALALPACGS